MVQPMIVTLPQRFGKDEALRRLKASFSEAQSSGTSLLVFKNQWSGNHLDFRTSLLGQSTTGNVDVASTTSVLEVQFPWLLSTGPLLTPKRTFGLTPLLPPLGGSSAQHRDHQPTAHGRNDARQDH